MTSDSSTGGFLSPSGSPPLDDDALDDFLQALVVGITGLPGQMVRPRWQEEPPNLPPVGTNWAAIGVTHRTADTFAVEQHDGSGQGADTLIRHESVDLLCSFYGPLAETNGALLRDGLGIAQNREVLQANSMGIVSVGDLTKAPELVKNRWLNRTDLTVVIRRQITRTYPVLNLLSAEITLETDAATKIINVA